tara:strand:- start:591 stop:1319 length:729 start_codon:yes stop_codon:yes gene_type:complete
VDILNWQDILKDWRPDATFTEEGSMMVSDEYNAKMNQHYLIRGEERLGRLSNSNIEKIVKCIRDSKVTGKFWLYLNSKLTDFSYIEGRVSSIGVIIFESVRAKDDRNKNRYQGYPSYAKFIDCWGTGIKKGHRQGNMMNPFDEGRPEPADHEEVYEEFKVNYIDPILSFTRKRNNVLEQNGGVETKQTLKFKEKIENKVKEMKRNYARYKRDHKEYFSQEVEDKLSGAIQEVKEEISKMLFI